MVRCPACKDYDVRQSRWSGPIERALMTMVLRRPVRCYTCFARFTVWKFQEVKPRVLKDFEATQTFKASA